MTYLWTRLMYHIGKGIIQTRSVTAFCDGFFNEDNYERLEYGRIRWGRGTSYAIIGLALSHSLEINHASIVTKSSIYVGLKWDGLCFLILECCNRNSTNEIFLTYFRLQYWNWLRVVETERSKLINVKRDRRFPPKRDRFRIAVNLRSSSNNYFQFKRFRGCEYQDMTSGP